MRAKELAGEHKSRWLFQAAEYPVEVRGHSTRIDFVMRASESRLLMVAECKRVNRAYSNWCFVRAPFLRRNTTSNELLAERIKFTETNAIVAGGAKLGHKPNVYHLAYEVKSHTPGDSGGPGRGAVEDAAAQVLRGVNGLAEHLARNHTLLGQDRAVFIVPVVFTTASLWTTEVDLSSADLETGKLPDTDLGLKGANWLWYRYHQSPGLKHVVPPDEQRDNLSEMLDYAHARTIAVVSALGIDEFLRTEWW
jgi:hypothetical protein